MNDDNKMMQGRREFMRSTSLLLTGSTSFAVMPNFSWAAGDSKLEHLAQVCYMMYPHPDVPKKFYYACAQGLLDKAAKDPKLASLLEEGQSALDSLHSEPFVDLTEEDQELALQRLAGKPYFQTVRGHTVVGLYNIPGIWAYFGYQGPSFPKGGYLDRGFDDIFWLKDA